MMSYFSPKIIWGLVAFAIYFLLLGLIVFYFNTNHEEKSKHYVKKDEPRIKIGVTSAQEKKNLKEKPKKSVNKPKKIVKEKQNPKKNREPKVRKKQVIKEKLVKKITKEKVKDIIKPKKKSVKKENKPKPKKTLDLFSDIKITPKKLDMNMTDKPIKTSPVKNIIEVKDRPLSASERISSTLSTQKESDSGVEDAYFAKVQSMLEDWPAQSDFAGEKATVVLYIKTSGMFEFKVKLGSSIEDFNAGLSVFLKQLQTIGFGPHTGERTYEYEAEFIAKE